MIAILVSIHVKPGAVEAFKAATVLNAAESLNEPGVARFDVVQQADDPTRFLLLEVYRYPNAPLEHKDTKHYQTWRDAVADMMATPRTSQKFVNIYPEDPEW